MAENIIDELIDREEDSGVIIPDPINGYDRVIPADDVLQRMIDAYCLAIEQTDADYVPQIKRLDLNEKAYDAEHVETSDVITLPTVKRIVNQQASWEATAILSKDPYITIRPLDGGEYELPWKITGQEPVPPSAGQAFAGMPPQQTFQTKKVSSEDAAKLYQRFLQYKLTEDVKFEELVEETSYAIKIGETPNWWKISYNPAVRYAKQKKFIQASKGVQVIGLEETEIRDRSAVGIEARSFRNITMPVTENDEQRSPWLQERTPLKSLEIWEGLKQGKYDLCMQPGADGQPAEIPLSDIRTLLNLAENPNDRPENLTQAAIEDRVASQPEFEHDVRTLWFFYPLKRTKVDPQTGQKKRVIEMRSLCATVHLKARRFLNLYVNPYWHGKRPYVPFFERKKPHRFTGTTTAGDVAPIQSLISSIYHAQINNLVQQNVKVFLIRKDSVTWNFLSAQSNKLTPGMKIPYDDKDDVNPVQLGAPVASMAQEIGFLDGQAARLAVTSDFDLGQNIPNRTPAATVSQVEQLAKVQPVSVLRAMRRSIARAMKMYLTTVAQFHAYEEIPFLDPETKQTISLLIGFPREIIDQHFSFHVTATGDEDSKQARFEKAGLAIKQIDDANETALKLMPMVLDPEQPPHVQAFATFCLLRREALVEEVISDFRLDTSRFVITPSLLTTLQEQAKEWAAQQAAAAAQQGGETDANSQLPTANTGGNVSAFPAGQPGSQQLQGQPGGQGVPQPPAPENQLQGAAAGGQQG
jgi:hypothetical protein